jgi:hypothetical protein
MSIHLRRSLQVGQFYHAASNSAPVAKIEWHPWGEAGSTLLVMTIDGKLRQVYFFFFYCSVFLMAMIREYDISVDTEEPQQVLSFVPERKSGSFMAEDESEREVASFTLGKGRADWGPLTVYAVMKSGDIYSICPYLPANAYVLNRNRKFYSSDTLPTVPCPLLTYTHSSVSYPPNKNFFHKTARPPKPFPQCMTINGNT